jgi:hypothetical protein
MPVHFAVDFLVSCGISPADRVCARAPIRDGLVGAFVFQPPMR